MTLQTISPAQAKGLIDQGARLIDIRGADEHARGAIPGAVNIPLGELGPLGPGRAVVFHCKTGMRTGANRDALAQAAGCEAYIIEGGMDAWAKAGLPTAQDKSQPIEIMRQVQIVAGGLIVLGVALGLLVAPEFYALAGFVGAGLMFAGITGWCGMARLLALMPWNRV